MRRNAKGSYGGDGANPSAALIMEKTENLYSTTLMGGACGYGTVFKLDTPGNETVLHSFTGTDGSQAYAALIMNKAGDLYGTTFYGGSTNDGTVFKLIP